MWGNTLLAATPAFLQRDFISAQICLRLIPFPFLVTKISPETVFCFPAYFSSFLHSLLGKRMVRIFPLSLISARPCRTASTVIYRSSDTRIPVAQIVSISRARRSRCDSLADFTSRAYYSRLSSLSLLRTRLRWIFRYFTLQSRHPR